MWWGCTSWSRAAGKPTATRRSANTACWRRCAQAPPATPASRRPETGLSSVTRITMSTFEADRDADEWLEVNNRAFSWHPENGGWGLADLEARRGTDWFDPKGFLIARDDNTGRMAGFCWTKMHPGRVGEIYIVG